MMIMDVCIAEYIVDTLLTCNKKLLKGAKSNDQSNKQESIKDCIGGTCVVIDLDTISL